MECFVFLSYGCHKIISNPPILAFKNTSVLPIICSVEFVIRVSDSCSK